eukprot:34196_1
MSMVYPVYVYIRAYQQENLKSPPSLFYASTAFFIILFIYYCDTIIYSVYWCSDYAIYMISYYITINLYILQGSIMTSILFGRLVFIFQNSVFVISKCTIYCYATLVGLAVVLGTIGQIVYYYIPGVTTSGLVLIGFAFLFYVTIIIWLNSIFVYKLRIVYKSCQDSLDENGKLLHIITKSSILCFSSTWFIILWFTMFVIRNMINSPHYYLVRHIVLIVDLYSNFLSILLSFNHFHPWYMKVCGCCHAKCHSFWNYCVNKDTITQQNTETKLQCEKTKKLKNEIELAASNLRYNQSGDKSSTDSIEIQQNNDDIITPSTCTASPEIICDSDPHLKTNTNKKHQIEGNDNEHQKQDTTDELIDIAMEIFDDMVDEQIPLK